jgi:hypothetical protein
LGREKSVLRCSGERSVLRCLGREECAQVFRKREEFIVFLIELDVTCLVVLGMKWIAPFYKIKPIRLIINPDFTVTKPTDNRL